MSNHTLYKCPTPCPDEGRCQFCEGGLSLCTVCGGGEGSLPSECPGVKMTEDEQHEVYAGRLDFRNGAWIAKDASAHPTMPPDDLNF